MPDGRRYRKVAIVGVGLVGGSVGRALISKRLAGEVAGVFRRRSTLEEAMAAGVVTSASMDAAAALDGAEVVLLATSVDTVLSQLEVLKDQVPDGALLTDTGSTKQAITGKMAAAFSHRRSVFPAGSHPLYGSHLHGPQAGALINPEGYLALVCPVEGHPNRAEAAGRAEEFWRLLGMHTLRLEASEHDRLLAYSSHLPHLLAYGLVRALPEDAERLVASGFLDSTRLAASLPQTWLEIFTSNREALLEAVGDFKEALAVLENAVATGDTDGLGRILTDIQARRMRLEKGRPATGVMKMAFPGASGSEP